VIEGITAQGVDVTEFGLASTPTFYFGVGKLNLDGGIQVSASHNPSEYNIDMIGTQTWKMLTLENDNNFSREVSIRVSDEIRDIVEFEQSIIKLNADEVKIIRFRIKFYGNETQGKIYLMEGLSQRAIIPITINRIESKTEFDSRLEEAGYKTNIYGNIALITTLNQAMIDFYLIPKIRGIFDILFMRISLFITLSIILSFIGYFIFKPRSIIGLILMIFAFIILSLIISLIIPQMIL